MEELKAYKASDGKIFFEDDASLAYKKCKEYEDNLKNFECEGLTMFDSFGRITKDFKSAKYIWMDYVKFYSKNYVAIKVIEKFKEVYAREPKLINAYTCGLLKFDQKTKEYWPISTETQKAYKNIFNYLIGK